MRLTLVLTLYWAVMVAARAADPPVAPLPVEVEQGDGAVTVGRLERIDAEGVRFVDVTGGSRSLPADRVRAVRRTDTTGDVPEGQRPTERPEMEGGPAKVVRTDGMVRAEEGRIMTCAHVGMCAWRPGRGGAERRGSVQKRRK